MILKITGKRVLVLGLGRSGHAAVRLLLKIGAGRVLINDTRDEHLLIKELGELATHPQVQLVAGGHHNEVLEHIAVIIKSPGINPNIPLLQEAKKLGIEIVSEVELAYHFCPVPLVGITGTNGKTTTTALVGEMLRLQFPGVLVAGNIGFAFSDAVLQSAGKDYIVVELSSFQLANIRNFRVHVGAVLNISADHLDYHGTMDGYVAAKSNIFRTQKSDDWSVVNWDDPLTRKMGNFVEGRLLAFSRYAGLAPGVFIKEGTITVNDGRNDMPVCRAAEVRIPGEHNLENALAATAVAWAAGVELKNIAHALRLFPGVPHRLEEVAEVRGVKFVNDSKGTNPNATLKAICALREPKVLIAGGFNKESDFSQLAAALASENVKALVLIGETAPLLQEAARSAGFNAIIMVEELRSAVCQAYRLADAGETVLLSPACASWDMFRDYEERGELFRQEVIALKESSGNG